MSAKKKDKGFAFRMTHIDTEEFAIIEDNFKDGEPSGLGTSIDFGVNPEERAVGVKAKFQFEQKKKPFLVIAATCGFDIEKKSWEKLFEADTNKVVLPQGFAAHLALLTIGTVRGILHEKTKGTLYNKYILPPVNVNDLIKEDFEINLKKG